MFWRQFLEQCKVDTIGARIRSRIRIDFHCRFRHRLRDSFSKIAYLMISFVVTPHIDHEKLSASISARDPAHFIASAMSRISIRVSKASRRLESKCARRSAHKQQNRSNKCKAGRDH